MSTPAPDEGQVIPLGRQMKEQFPLDPAFRSMNHGSFGSCPNVVLKAQQKFQAELKHNPDIYIRFTAPVHIDASRAAIAKYLNVPTNEVVFVKNATTGVNLVLRNLQYQPGDVIVYFYGVYGGCERTVAYVVETTCVKARKVMLDFPCTHDDMVQRFMDVVKQVKAEGLNVKVALFDTISSQPGIRLPFERLVEICREEGILSCIDGAHGAGQITLDLAALDADFFVSNCHKWLFTPLGSAVFHVPVRNQHLLRSTMPTSWGFLPAPDVLNHAAPGHKNAVRFRGGLPSTGTKSEFEMLFEYVGTNDDTPYSCIPAALEFRQNVCGGEARIMEYCESLAFDGGNLVAKILGTEVLCEPGAENQTVRGASAIRRCALVNVRLPIGVDDENGQHDGKERSYPVLKSEDAGVLGQWIEKELLFTYNTYVPVFQLGGWMWTRLSAQVYLDLEDFESTGHTLKDICERIGKGQGPEGLEIENGVGNLTIS
ncbi:hypothetical protein LOZ61_006516 [Ophidiomyces ophidiicola]|uniref:Uncharacterized protein n=1 Tax=Ophidiomyces ophidiicola TaxID=1387563 RepID=A0ACB8V3X7_9EURO|nr:uncharacterized protein LOZ57_005193 [Ophidiomyces ophidiicola]KAI1906724.1 hypothetical protein LOZ61_006516 [Ophidiomyces ophidiicola]KAI1923372.1 hypothetical protein LOZ64_001048 [Ophidiomyces ophidiicola]KAI1930051.1 hypothetical protein LOZ60_001109 [Ophidiomyces ophidiicola]KAI1943245.1 hypothetical protein LOZ57_005193 [Ophidiomyces ophidiicola]KAI1963709.1 hypothetical protein LOZ56_006339 [Ophidiomyces ophidiicola]